MEKQKSRKNSGGKVKATGRKAAGKSAARGAAGKSETFGEKLCRIFDQVFGGFNLTWKRLVLFAVLAGVYTAAMALLPAAKETSFADISISFEVWILFGIFIIMNSKSMLDSALKCFGFFLISQPLVYLIQVPFNDQGFELFRHYGYWFLWTLATPVMGAIGYLLKARRWWGILILLPILVFLGVHYNLYLKETIFNFPHHLLSTVFCLVTLMLYATCLFRERETKIASVIIGILILLVATVLALGDPIKYETTVMTSGGDSGMTFDENYRAYLKNSGLGEVRIVYDEGVESYALEGAFTHAGETELVLEDEAGNRTMFKLVVKNDNTEVERAW